MIRKIIRKRHHHLPRECYRGYISVSFAACVWKHSPLFTADEVVTNFVNILDWARKIKDCVVLLYCFMPDGSGDMLWYIAIILLAGAPLAYITNIKSKNVSISRKTP